MSTQEEGAVGEERQHDQLIHPISRIDATSYMQPAAAFYTKPAQELIRNFVARWCGGSLLARLWLTSGFVLWFLIYFGSLLLAFEHGHLHTTAGCATRARANPTSAAEQGTFQAASPGTLFAQPGLPPAVNLEGGGEGVNYAYDLICSSNPGRPPPSRQKRTEAGWTFFPLSCHCWNG